MTNEEERSKNQFFRTAFIKKLLVVKLKEVSKIQLTSYFTLNKFFTFTKNLKRLRTTDLAHFYFSSRWPLPSGMKRQKLPSVSCSRQKISNGVIYRLEKQIFHRWWNWRKMQLLIAAQTSCRSARWMEHSNFLWSLAKHQREFSQMESTEHLVVFMTPLTTDCG